MKPATTGLDDLLASRKFFAVDLYTIILVDGTELRFCAGDQDIEYAGDTYSAGGMTGALFELPEDDSSTSWTIGLSADTMVVNIIPREQEILGVEFKQAIRYGLLDGAVIRQDLAIMPTYGDTAEGLVLMFLGRVAECDIGDLKVAVNLNSPLELLDQTLPRNLFQPGCTWTLFDAGCTVLQSSFQTAGVIVTGSTGSTLLVDGPSQVTDYFNQGKVVITSGVNAGISRTIKKWTKGISDQGTLTIWPPLPQTPSAGDTLNIYPGCDKTDGANGCAKFSNLVNFRGFKTVPVTETAI